MRAFIKLVTSEKITSKGYPIYTGITQGQKRARFVVGHSFDHDWNTFKNEPFNTHPNYLDLMPKVLEYKAKISRINVSYTDFHKAKSYLFDGEKSRVNGFLAFFDSYIEERKIKGLTYESFENVRKIFGRYVGVNDVGFNEINYEYLNKYVVYQLKSGTGLAGVMSYLRTIRSVYKEAQRRSSLGVNPGNPFSGLIKKVPSKKIIDIDSDDFKKLQNLKFKKSTTKKSIDVSDRNLKLWYFQLIIGGHDLVDVALLKWADFNDGRVSFHRYKNRNLHDRGPKVDNKVFSLAHEIVKDIGTQNNKRVFGFIPDPTINDGKYKNFQRAYNRSLESISEAASIRESIKSKSTRYLFKTAAAELLIPNTVSKILQGHTLTNDDVSFNYIGKISTKVLDKQHKKILARFFDNLE